MTTPSLVDREKLSKIYWEPYVITGYRPADISVRDCLRYTLVFHNDVGNFWSHFVFFLAWLAWLGYLSFRLDLSDPFWYPLLVMWFGGCSYAFCSSLAHCMATKSVNYRQICFLIDYQGIALYAFGGDVAYGFYERAIGSSIYEYKWTLTIAYVLLALNSTLVCSLSRFYCGKQRYLVRTLSFALPYLAGMFPFVNRLFLCVFHGEQCISQTLHLHFTAFLVSLAMVFFFVTKLPERVYPGKFDYVFHSHQLFHIASATITSLQFYFIPTDATIRKEALLQNPYLAPDVYTTFVPMAIVTIGGFSIVAVFGILVVLNVLTSNKLHMKHD